MMQEVRLFRDVDEESRKRTRHCPKTSEDQSRRIVYVLSGVNGNPNYRVPILISPSMRAYIHLSERNFNNVKTYTEVLSRRIPRGLTDKLFTVSSYEDYINTSCVGRGDVTTATSSSTTSTALPVQSNRLWETAPFSDTEAARYLFPRHWRLLRLNVSAMQVLKRSFMGRNNIPPLDLLCRHVNLINMSRDAVRYPTLSYNEGDGDVDTSAIASTPQNLRVVSLLTALRAPLSFETALLLWRTTTPREESTMRKIVVHNTRDPLDVCVLSFGVSSLAIQEETYCYTDGLISVV